MGSTHSKMLSFMNALLLASANVQSPAPLPTEVFQAVQRGELQMLDQWLGKGGSVDAVCSAPTDDGETTAVSLLHATATVGHLEITKKLLRLGASVDLQTSHGLTALMAAAQNGHLSVLLVLLQHSANPDLQNIHNGTTLMSAAYQGHEACVQALLAAGANTELPDSRGSTALQWAEAQGHTAITELLRQHASCLSLGLGVTLCTVVPLIRSWVVPLIRSWVVLSLVLGAIATVAFSHTLTVGPGQHQVAQQRRPHRPARHAKAKGRTTTTEPIRQQAPPPPAAAVAPHAVQTAQVVAWADGVIEAPLAEEAAEQAKAQTRSKKSKKKNKTGRATTAGDESSEAPPTAVPAPPPAAAPMPAASAAERAESALRAAIAGGGLSALAAAPREVPQGSLGAEAHARCDKLLKAQQEADREAKHAVAVQAARLAAVKRVREVNPDTAVETLTPDFMGVHADIEKVVDSGIAVFAQNIETVYRLTHPVRDPRAGYQQTLDVLAHAKAFRPKVLTKTSLMLGLGESEAEIVECMDDLRAANVDILTLGQYLQPTPNHYPIARYVSPEEFERYRQWGLEKGFFEVVSGVFVRSSYRAEQVLAKNNVGLP